jgi:hypothetical protein
MSNTKNTGGAAFPDPAAERKYADCEGYEHGMTLRDYFAAKAMVAQWTWFAGGEAPRPSEKNIAEWAYEQADAMLKARNQ